jgi:hypothetical protein
MSKASVSITAYSLYLAPAGLVMAFIPNVLVRVLSLPPIDGVWIRLFGFFAIMFAVKGYHGARLNLVSSMQLDVISRVGFTVFLVVLIVMGVAPPIMAIFGAIDLIAAVWTQIAIFVDKRSAA